MRKQRAEFEARLPEEEKFKYGHLMDLPVMTIDEALLPEYRTIPMRGILVPTTVLEGVPEVRKGTLVTWNRGHLVELRLFKDTPLPPFSSEIPTTSGVGEPLPIAFKDPVPVSTFRHNLTDLEAMSPKLKPVPIVILSDDDNDEVQEVSKRVTPPAPQIEDLESPLSSTSDEDDIPIAKRIAAAREKKERKDLGSPSTTTTDEDDIPIAKRIAAAREKKKRKTEK